MAATIGVWLAGLIAVAIFGIGLRFFFDAHRAAAAYGVAVTPNPAFDAFLSVKGVRDIASGLVIGVLIFHGSHRVLGEAMAAFTAIPIGDCAIVLRHGGSRAAAFGIHGATAVLMLVISGLLFFG